MGGILLISSAAQGQSILYVDDDAPAGGDGLNWSTAFNELQSALHAATAGDQIWVASGTYKPDYDMGAGTYTGNRTATFQLINGVAIYGGLAGNEDPATFDLDDRDFVANQTILSGDLSGDDVEDLAGALACFTISSVPSGPGCDVFDLDHDGDVDSDDLKHTENSYHVVTGNNTDETAVLDGFTITAGKGSYRCGAGMHNQNGSPVIANCIFLTNFDGSSGAGVFNTNSSPSFIDCAFVVNRSGSSSGGGMCNKDNSNPLLTNCKFIGNWANRGGGICSTQSTPSLINCIFISNHSTWTWGGGMFNYENNPTLINCLFSCNSGRYGGAIVNSYSNPTLINCTFSGNTVTEHHSGGIYNSGSSNPTLVNCIFWNNSDRGGIDESAQIHGGTPTVSFSCIQGLDTFVGNGNIGDSPLFSDADGPDDIVGTEDDDLRLQSSSPCIDVGDNSAVPIYITFDLEGNPRIINVTVDMGAYEYDPMGDYDGDGIVNSQDNCPGVSNPGQEDMDGDNVGDVCDNCPGVSNIDQADSDANGIGDACEGPEFYVDDDASPGGDGLTWATAFNELQSALDVAASGNRIWVAAGTYRPSKLIDPGDPRTATFELVDEVEMYGGFVGNEDPAMFDLGNRDFDTNKTILSGDLNGDDGSDFADNDENSYHVVLSVEWGAETFLDGFVITAGNANYLKLTDFKPRGAFPGGEVHCAHD
jgi:hypothetical protein